MSKKKKKKSTEDKDQTPTMDLGDSSLYLNREFGEIRFNERVLEEALDETYPLLERVKFLAIFASNLDEFFMIRVSGLCRQLAAGVLEAPPDGMTPREQLHMIHRELRPLLRAHAECWRDDVLPQLKEVDINVLKYNELKRKQKKHIRSYFDEHIFPVLTPLAFDPGHPFPQISNLSMNLAVVIKAPVQSEQFARVKIPRRAFPRFLRVPDEDDAETPYGFGVPGQHVYNFVLLEDVISANLDLLFPGFKDVEAYPFRVTRDADLEIEEDEAADLLATIEENIKRMPLAGLVVRLEVHPDMPERVRQILVSNLSFTQGQDASVAPIVYTSEVDTPLGMADLMELTKVDRPALKYPPYIPSIPRALETGESFFSVIKRRDIFLYHPYDSFNAFLSFLREAARDQNVLAIKQTLYRVGPNAPVVDLLLKAREREKQVAVLVELKARFDEENNIGWARKLERNGVHVSYGLVGLKTHAKMCMVVRRERDGRIVRYVHLGTGNYNATTARMYTDLGFFTCDPEIGADAADVFNALTGYSQKDSYRKLLVAPGRMREQILERIEREIEQHKQHGDGYLGFKMNALVDQPCIEALYRASQAGVKIDLQVRRICCLRPGVPGVSDNITVTSVVGRFLEHPRLFYFRNGGDDELILGSADLMPRNLDRRVEVLFPVEDPLLKKTIYEQILRVHLRDNVQARQLLPDGSYKRLTPDDGDPELDSQDWMIEHRGMWSNELL